MEDQSKLGMIMLSILCLIPMVAGGVIGWLWRGRVQRYGLPGALLPEWIRKLLEDK